MEKETVWLSQKQMAELFATERSVITKHIRNIFKTKELHEDSACAKFAHAAEDGKVYQTQFYNLDIITATPLQNSLLELFVNAWKIKIRKTKTASFTPFANLHEEKGFLANGKNLCCKPITPF